MNEKRQKKGFHKKYYIIIVIAFILIDQLSKMYITKTGLVSENNLSFSIIENVLSISYVENRGGAFGIGQGNTIAFVIANIIVLAMILKFVITQKETMNKILGIALALILSGGISNLIDRIWRGFVLDFIDFSAMIKLPVFNIADSIIIAGWILLVIDTLIHYAKNKEEGKII